MTGMVAGASLALAPAASADQSPSVCGSSYRTVYGPMAVYTGNRVFAGYVYVAYSSSTGNNCAYFTVSPATKASTGYKHSVTIRNSSTGRQSKKDEGAYNSFAGPVYIKAPGACVEAWGTVSYPTSPIGGKTGYYDTYKVACG
jgi:hypothetical protein